VSLPLAPLAALLLAAAPTTPVLAGAPTPEQAAALQTLLDRRRPNAPDLDRVGTWLGTDRPLLFRDALRGRVVLLDFWTSGCVNCIHGFPVLKALEQHFPGEPFQVIGIHSGKFDAEKEVPAIAEAMGRHGIDYPVGTDSDFVIWEQYGVHAWPTTVLIDAQGQVAVRFAGEADATQLTFYVQALLADARKKGFAAAGPATFRRPPVASTGPLAFPGKVLALSDGGLAVADTGHHRLLLLDGKGALRRAVGSGLEGFSDGPPETASFRRPQGLAERDGQLYVADTENHAIRRVDLASGKVETIAGNGRKGERIAPSPDARSEALRSPWDVAFIGDALWVAMAGSHQLWQLDVRSGALAAGAGDGQEGLLDGPLATAQFAQPSGLATDGKVLYVADSEASAIRVVDPAAAQVRTLVGAGVFEFGDRDGPAQSARLQHPLGLSLQGRTLFIADTFNGRVRRLALDAGQLGTVTAKGLLAQPGGLTARAGELLVADTDHHRLVSVDPATGALRPLVPSGVTAPRLGGWVERPVLATRALPVQHLGDATLASAASTLVLEVRLPDGYSFTEGAPQRVEVSSPARRTGDTRIETSGNLLRASTALEGFPLEGTAVQTVTLFYCHSGGNAVCLVDRRRLVARVSAVSGGPDTAIVRYTPAPPAAGG
jgi:sugar lactone lactonase YvrE/thiol-disulfide isomerase/thioredoxin